VNALSSCAVSTRNANKRDPAPPDILNHMLRVFVVGVVLVLLAAGLCVSRVFFPPLPVRPDLLRNLPVGASKQEVSTLLGSPTQIMTDNRIWSYYRPDGRKTVYIFFDTNMLYSRYQVDD
jgi:hypothetical protein